MVLRVTDLMIDAAAKKKPAKKPAKNPPKKSKPCGRHTSPRCKTCTTITAATGHNKFTGNTCTGLYANTVAGELLSQLRATLDESRTDGEIAEVAA